MSRTAAAILVACAFLAGACASEGGGSGAGYVDLYGGANWDDYWYAGGGCCVDYPGEIGPPAHPEHPIAKPPSGGARPSQPIATPPSSRPMPAPRGMSRGGGGRR